MDAPQELLRGSLIAVSIDRPVVYGPFVTYAEAIRECRAAGGNDRFVVTRVQGELSLNPAFSLGFSRVHGATVIKSGALAHACG